MTEEQRQSNYTRIRRNQEIRKWELENPKKAMTFAIIENVLAIVGFALIVWFCFSYSSPYVRIRESKSYFSIIPLPDAAGRQQWISVDDDSNLL